MGTQQLLLIVLGVVIVGIAIAVGVTMFRSNAQSSDRDQVVSDLENLGSKAQQYYRKPLSFAGGSNDFLNFRLTPLDTGNGNGSYSITTTEPTDAGFVSGSLTPISSSSQLLYIVGSGKETGDNGTDPVKASMMVTKDSLMVTILN